MIKMYCDICGKELSDDCHDVVNIDFNSFGTAGFTLEIDKYKPKASELNLCVECAEKVVSDIEDIPEDIWDISERIYEWMYENG